MVLVPVQNEPVGVEPEKMSGSNIMEVDVASSRIDASVYDSSTVCSVRRCKFDVYFGIVGDGDGLSP